MEGKIFYVTKEKLSQLEKEYKELVVLERNKTVGVEAPKILESEDMSPEFISYHEDMESLRGRIDELKNIIEHHEIIKNPPKEQQELVNIGAKVKVHTGDEKNEFLIVGTLEANPEAGMISNESPVGKALLGHKVGDEVKISSTKKVYKIKDINYEIS
jgi:transcription elongation factor GreA